MYRGFYNDSQKYYFILFFTITNYFRGVFFQLGIKEKIGYLKDIKKDNNIYKNSYNDSIIVWF